MRNPLSLVVSFVLAFTIAGFLQNAGITKRLNDLDLEQGWHAWAASHPILVGFWSEPILQLAGVVPAAKAAAAVKTPAATTIGEKRPLALPPDAPARKPLIPTTGEDLVDQIAACRRAAPNIATTLEVCHGLQSGVIGGIAVYAAVIRAPMPFCMPKTATDVQIDDAVLAFVARHPKSARWGSTAVILGAVMERFPCPKIGAAAKPSSGGKPAPAQTKPAAK